MAHLYYAEELSASELAPGQTVWVTGEEARHAVRVSRLRVGEVIQVGDGAGVVATGEVIEADRDRFAVRITESFTSPPADRRVVLVQALAKGDRDERAVEQATEFGVHEIIPWQAERSVSRWQGDDKRSKGVEKWQRIAREASKQSMRARVPKVSEPLMLDGLATLAGERGVDMLVLHPAADARLSIVRSDARTLVLVVGPEGGLSETELTRLNAAGARAVRLGDTVLRTSSAGPAALAVLNTVFSFW